MVGRFNVRRGSGDDGWVVWDNAMNGSRGSDPSEAKARLLAADLELQFDAHGPRDPANVWRPDKPVPVDAWQQQIGELDAWIREGSEWIGRVRLPDGGIRWIGGSELRPTEAADAANGRRRGGAG